MKKRLLITSFLLGGVVLGCRGEDGRDGRDGLDNRIHAKVTCGTTLVGGKWDGVYVGFRAVQTTSLDVFVSAEISRVGEYNNSNADFHAASSVGAHEVSVYVDVGDYNYAEFSYNPDTTLLTVEIHSTNGNYAYYPHLNVCVGVSY